MNSLKLLLLIIGVFLVCQGHAQMKDADLIAQKVVQTNTTPSKIGKKRSLNPVVWAFQFYKKSISPQIINDCIYEVSCSAFSHRAIDRFGFFKGLFLTGDRLTRCNRVSYSQASPFRINKQGKLIDSLDQYAFKRP